MLFWNYYEYKNVNENIVRNIFVSVASEMAVLLGGKRKEVKILLLIENTLVWYCLSINLLEYMYW